MVIPAVTKPKSPSGLASDARNPVRNGKPRLVPVSRRITNHYHLPDKYSYYAHTLSILDSHIHPIGSGAIYKKQIPHTQVKPIDYIGLYIIVVAASCITVNWLARIYL